MSVSVLSAVRLSRSSLARISFPSALGRSASTQSALPDTSSASTAPVEETAEAMRLRAIKLYKELHRLGRDYPDPEYGFNKRLRRAYEKNAKNTDPAALKKQLELAEHIKKEVLALISLKKFRHLRRTYYKDEPPR